MTSFEDTANALGQLVVQVSANAVRSNELAKSTKESYDIAMNYIHELRKAQKDQQELIEDLQKRLDEPPEEPSSKRLRTEAPWTRSHRDPTRSEYAESQVGSQSGFLCYRCHKHCGSSAKNCEVEIPDLEMSSVLDLYTRIAHRGKKDERNELDKVVEEFGRRGYRLPEDGKVAKRMREALQLFEKNPEKGMPLEYRVVPEETPTPLTPGAKITEVIDDDPEPKGDEPKGDEPKADAPKVGDQSPEVKRLREDVQKFMKDILSTISQLGQSGQSKSSNEK